MEWVVTDAMSSFHARLQQSLKHLRLLLNLASKYFYQKSIFYMASFLKNALIWPIMVVQKIEWVVTDVGSSFGA